MSKKRFIVHVDMDAFFAAIEQRDNQKLRGLPVVVGADPKGGKGRGVVSTCSYEARKFGIRSAMPISTAYRLCPNAVFLPVDMPKYSAASRQIYDIFYEFTPEIEPVSIDEAFLDMSGSFHLFGTPLDACLKLKSRIKEKTSLTASVGLAPNKMAAKIASDMNKPDGMVEVTREGLQKFLWPLDISRIWGLGPTSKKALNDMGIFTIGELAAFPPERLQALFGKAGLHYWELANGIDERNVEAEGEAKSISNEVTFDEDTSDRDRITTAMMELCEKTSWRLRREGLMARTVTVKIRLSGFETHTRSETVKKMTNFTDDTYRTAMGLYDGFDNRGKKVRLVGVKLSNLMPFGTTEDLFRSPEDPKREEVHKAVDQIVDRFGSGAIFRATAWRKTPSRRGRAP